MARFREPLKNVFANACGIGGPCALKCLAKNAPVAQLDRALDYESRGQEFESLRARHFGIKLRTPTAAYFSETNILHLRLQLASLCGTIRAP